MVSLSLKYLWSKWFFVETFVCHATKFTIFLLLQTEFYRQIPLLDKTVISYTCLSLYEITRKKLKVHITGECSVRDEDCPLILALTCSDHLQFVLRVYQQGVEAPEPPPSHVKSKIQQSNNFFAAMKKKLQKARSKDNVSSCFFSFFLVQIKFLARNQK